MAADNQKRARRHHILPQSYLRWFASEDKVNIVDFEQPKPYLTNILNAACIDDFYTVETTEKLADDCIEQAFLAKLEGLPGPIVETIVQDLSVPQGRDWAILANYVALMYVRGPRFRQIVLNVYTDSAKKLAEVLHSDELIWQDAMSQVERETGEKVTMEFDEACQVYKNCQIGARIPRNLWVRLMMEMASDLVGVFQEMTPNLLYIPVWRNAEFITGDMPIQVVSMPKDTARDWKWLRNPEADLFFPLGPRKGLLLNYDSRPEVLKASRRGVAWINHVMALNCTRIVVSQKPSFVWLRTRGTISESVDELVQFVRDTPESGSMSGDNWSVLRGER